MSALQDQEGRPSVAVAAAEMGQDEGAAGSSDGTTATWTVRVWTAPGAAAEEAGVGLPLWERQLVTPDIQLVRGDGDGGGGEGDGGASFTATAASAAGDDVDGATAAMNNVAIANADVDADDNASTFDARAYFACLRTRRDGKQLLTAKELPSTQNLIQENAAAVPPAVPPGVVCVADLQVNGRGGAVQVEFS